MVTGDGVVARTGVDFIRTTAAEHHIVARTSGDAVIAVIGRRSIGQVRRKTGGECHLTLVTENNIGAIASRNHIGPATTKHKIVAIAGADLVRRPRIRGRHETDRKHAGKCSTSGIAEDHIPTVTCDNDIGAGTAEDHIVAIARENVVVTTQRGCRGRKGNRQAGNQSDRARVAKDLVCTVAAANRVGTRAAEDHVVARPGSDDVVTTDSFGRGGGGDILSHEVAGHITLVTQHDVAALAGCDRIGTEATHKGVVTRSGSNRIITPDREVRGGKRENRRRGDGEGPMVTRDGIVAVAGIDRVTRLAAEDEIATAQCGDGIGIAVRRNGRANADDEVAGQSDRTMVAEDNIVPRTGMNAVAASTANDQIATGSGGDRIVTAAGEIGLKPRDEPIHHGEPGMVAGHGIVTLASINDIGAEATKDEVVTAATRDRVSATDRRIDRESVQVIANHTIGEVARATAAEDGDHITVFIQIVHPPMVTKDKVTTGAADDRVSTGATKDNQREAGS